MARLIVDFYNRTLLALQAPSRLCLRAVQAHTVEQETRTACFAAQIRSQQRSPPPDHSKGR